jgi:hypothetical protein
MGMCTGQCMGINHTTYPLGMSWSLYPGW